MHPCCVHVSTGEAAHPAVTTWHPVFTEGSKCLTVLIFFSSIGVVAELQVMRTLSMKPEQSSCRPPKRIRLYKAQVPEWHVGISVLVCWMAIAMFHIAAEVKLCFVCVCAPVRAHACTCMCGCMFVQILGHQTNYYLHKLQIYITFACFKYFKNISSFGISSSKAFPLPPALAVRLTLCIYSCTMTTP